MSNVEERSEVVEPRWMQFESGSSRYEQQIDINSRDHSMRHRERRYSGEPIDEWKPGPAPVESNA